MKNLRDLRHDKGLYQKDIAKMLNMSQTGYSQYENETNDIPTETLKKLAIFYNTSIDYILGFTNIKTPYPRIRFKNNNNLIGGKNVSSKIKRFKERKKDNTSSSSKIFRNNATAL